MRYMVKKQSDNSKGSEWDSSFWDLIRPAQINNYMGEMPVHFPKAQVKLTYDNTSVYVHFRVEDRFVRAVTTIDQGNVWEDSCVEFFFTPSEDISRGYFNIEINCIGTMLFNFQLGRNKGRVEIPRNECEMIKRFSSIRSVIDPEITEPLTWNVQYSIPVELLKGYSDVTDPEPGVKWRANFYKCGDRTSHPHWLTWSPIDRPKPDFHRPGSFGVLEFG